MKKVGTVLEDEKMEIQEIYEKKIALETLLKCMDLNDDELYKKIIIDYTDIQRSFDVWWKKMYEKYNWESGASWQIDFDSNEIFVLGPEV